jgi:tetratricopeptide (TPR) repeat protein
MEPSLSVCLIARNEESSLPRALASVRGLAGEIIVADTGSTDRTRSIAEDFGAVVSDFPWCDDFSAARNFAVGQARGDWILWLDADEELLPGSEEELRGCLRREDALAYLVRFQDLREPGRLDHYAVMWHLRLFRRRDDLRFLGRCHPHFEPGVEQIVCKTGLRVHHSSITLRHYGYVSELRPSKLRRAARLLELELRERPGQLYYMAEYGRTLLLLGDERGHEILSEAVARILPLADEPEPPTPMVALVLEHFLHAPPGQLPAGVTAEQIVDLATRWFPSSPPLIWLLARQAADAGRFEEAEQRLRSLVEMGRDQSYDQRISFDPRIVGCDARLNLGVCLVRQGKVNEAMRLFSELVTDPDRATEAREYIEALEEFLRQSAAAASAGRSSGQGPPPPV